MEMQFKQLNSNRGDANMQIERMRDEEYESANRGNTSEMYIEHSVHDKFDRESAHNPQLVTEVTKHIFMYLKQIEVRLISKIFISVLLLRMS